MPLLNARAGKARTCVIRALHAPTLPCPTQSPSLSFPLPPQTNRTRVLERGPRIAQASIVNSPSTDMNLAAKTVCVCDKHIGVM